MKYCLNDPIWMYKPFWQTLMWSFIIKKVDSLIAVQNLASLFHLLPLHIMSFSTDRTSVITHIVFNINIAHARFASANIYIYINFILLYDLFPYEHTGIHTFNDCSNCFRGNCSNTMTKRAEDGQSKLLSIMFLKPSFRPSLEKSADNIVGFFYLEQYTLY